LKILNTAKIPNIHQGTGKSLIFFHNVRRPACSFCQAKFPDHNCIINRTVLPAINCLCPVKVLVIEGPLEHTNYFRGSPMDDMLVNTAVIHGTQRSLSSY